MYSYVGVWVCTIAGIRYNNVNFFVSFIIRVNCNHDVLYTERLSRLGLISGCC